MWEKSVTLNYMTPLQAEIATMGKIKLTDSESDTSTIFYMEYDSNKFKAQIESIKLKDNRLRNSWGNKINRIVLKSTNNLLADEFNIKILCTEQ